MIFLNSKIPFNITGAKKAAGNKQGLNLLESSQSVITTHHGDGIRQRSNAGTQRLDLLLLLYVRGHASTVTHYEPDQLGMETDGKLESGYPRYPNPFPCVSDPFPS